MGSRAKPFGLVATAVWAGLSGAVLLSVGFLLLVASDAPGMEGILFTVVGVCFSALGVVVFASVYGIWTLQEWGRSLMFWYCVGSIPLGLLVSIAPVFPEQEITTGDKVLHIVDIAIAIAVMWYLTRERIKTLFAPV